MRPCRLALELALAVTMPTWAWASAGSAVCASCHREIYESYSQTPMARSARKLDSTAAPERFDKAEFDHPASGFTYRIAASGNGYLLQFQKPNAVKGEKEMAYAVGSGAKAFSYLISEGGFLYEAPVAYYSETNAWALAPGYSQYSYPYLNRPIVPGCLTCHASNLQVDAQTLNRFADPPFLEGGVACERCHGDGTAHVTKMRSGDITGDLRILNPANLPPAKRDSVCAQCHLTGDVRVMRAGSDWNSFQPGGVLADYQTNFVRTQKSGAMTVTGHVENLQLSACKRASGEKLWCGSCHDPHVVPAPAETAATFRTRCLNCHTSKPCTEKAVVRAQTKDNCIGCHMPKSTASDAQHVVLTDHSIPRRPRGNTAASKTTADAELAPFDGAKSTPRDLALAYAYAAVGKTAGADRARATSLLERVVKQSPNDTEVLVSLAEIYRNEDKNAMARPLYRRAIQLDPGQATALAGLGAILMESGQYTEAVRLWKEALTKNAGLELVRLNLSLALLKIGDRAAAISNLRQALTINPAFAPARDLLSQLNSAR